MEEKTDAVLVALARDGDKDSFGLLTSRYQDVAGRFAKRLLDDAQTAQDLTQEALVQAYTSLAGLRDPARFKSWLLGIVFNLCRSHIRDRKPSSLSLEAIIDGVQPVPDIFSAPTPAPEQLAEDRELRRIVQDAVNALSPDDRDIILLFYYAQLSLQEIGTATNTSTGNVKVRLQLARGRLKIKLAGQYPEIIPMKEKERNMIRVTIADVVKQQPTDVQTNQRDLCVVVLLDAVGRRALPIWIGASEGEAIALGLTEFATPRPMTFNFLVGLLQTLSAQVEEVRIERLKNTTFYAIVKIRVGKVVKEIDARPSDALALALRTGSPIFVAEDVLETGGVYLPPAAAVSPARNGAEAIIKEIETRHRTAEKGSEVSSPQAIAKAKADVISTVFTLK